MNNWRGTSTKNMEDFPAMELITRGYMTRGTVVNQKGIWTTAMWFPSSEDGCGGWTGASRRVGRTHTRHTHVRYLYRSTNLPCLPTHLSIYLSIHRSIYPSIYLSVYLFVDHCLPISIPLQYLSISLSLFLSISIYFVKCAERDATNTHGALPTKLCKFGTYSSSRHDDHPDVVPFIYPMMVALIPNFKDVASGKLT